MRTLLTNEERLARLRARWKRQQESRKLGKYKTLLPTTENLTCGRAVMRQEKSITPAMMRMAERYFWGKRGVQTEWQSWGVRDIPATAMGGTR